MHESTISELITGVSLMHAMWDFPISDGSIITYLDSDNSWTDDYLLFVVHYLHGQGFQCAYAAQDLVDGEKRLGTRFSLFALDSIIESNYIDLNVFSHQRSLYEDLGGFDESLKRVVDWDLILKYVKHHQPVSIPAVLCQYSHDDRPDRISASRIPWVRRCCTEPTHRSTGPGSNRRLPTVTTELCRSYFSQPTKKSYRRIVSSYCWRTRLTTEMKSSFL